MSGALAIHTDLSAPRFRGPHRRAGAALVDANALIQSIAQSSDRQAFVKLFDHFAPRVKALLIRQGTPPDLAEELAQETLLMVWRKAALFDPSRAGASTWIAAIARNLRIDAARREKRSRLPEVFDIIQGEEPEQPDQVLSGSERDSRVRAALTNLSPISSESFSWLSWKVSVIRTWRNACPFPLEPSNRGCGSPWRACAACWRICDDRFSSSVRGNPRRLRRRSS